MNLIYRLFSFLTISSVCMFGFAGASWGLASNNVPLDSSVYLYLEKLSGTGLIRTDFRGLRPFSRAEAARLVLEAERILLENPSKRDPLTDSFLKELHVLLAREISLYAQPGNAPRFDVNPLLSQKIRYAYVDGRPRTYERPVHDPGGDGVFGIGSGLRPDNPYPSPAQQHGTEGTPLMENNEGIRYGNGSNLEARVSGEVYIGQYVSALLEPVVVATRETESTRLFVNKSYAKLGGGGLELEIGRDANWFGLGARGALTLTNNAKNFDLVKLSSPEPVRLGSIGDLKYSLMISRFDAVQTSAGERQPYLFAGKLSLKPAEDLELGLNIGRQVGGPGVNNGVGETLRGLIGGTNSDNSNSLAGLEIRYRIPYLRNTEVYGEFSGEDTASFWPIVESYVAGFYIPRLTGNGRDDFRFEYFYGNAILYTNGTFQEGYIYHGMPVGHSQGGAAQDFFARYTHWFSVRNRLMLDYIHGERGNHGRVEMNSARQFDPNGIMQAVERRNSYRVGWNLPLRGDWDLNMMYGWERINNADLVDGATRTNQVVRFEVSYRY